VGINTDQVMSIASTDGGKTWMMLYTPEPDGHADDDWIWLAVLWRNPEGIIEVARRSRFKTVGQFNEGLAEHMRRAMEGEDDGAD
jgi:hypothetical protein